MPQESIFHKLIKNENSYTQLLCNMLRRDGKFRDDFFSLIGVPISPMNASRIQTQKGLEGHGQADILIESSNIYIIVEVKTESLRRMTDNQLLSTPKGYLRWLERKLADSAEGWLIYLVPANWELLEDKKDEILVYQRDVGNTGVHVSVILWEDVISLMPESKQSRGFSVLEEFRSLLCERFGPITFDDKEVELMLSESFPVGMFLKLNALIDAVRLDLNPKSKLDIHKDEFGFYLQKSSTCELYFGCWLDFWENTSCPLCFGIQYASAEVRDAFVRSLRSVYEQDAVFQGDWMMGRIPGQDIGSPLAVKLISSKLKLIWHSMSEADA
jgi:hypothetical protein